MFFLIISLSRCQNHLNFTSTDFITYKEIVVNMNPLDKIEIELFEEAYFSSLAEFDGLSLTIDIKKPNGRVVTYGPFDHNMKIIGLKYKNNICTLKFFNEGTRRIKFAIGIRSFDYLDDKFLEMYNFPILKYEKEVLSEKMKDQLIFERKTHKDGTEMWEIFVIVFGSFYTGYFIYGSCFAYCFYNCCCKKKKA